MSQAAILILISAIVVTIADILAYAYLKRHPENLSIPFLIAVIVVTIVPIAILVYMESSISLAARAIRVRYAVGRALYA